MIDGQTRKKKTTSTRRKFLKVAVTAAVVNTTVGNFTKGPQLLASLQKASNKASAFNQEKMEKYYDNFPSAEEMHRRWAMVIDLRKCIGCHSCDVSCKTENNIPLGVFRAWVKAIEKEKYPHTKILFLPRMCNHCDNPVCVTVCPVKATYKRSDGVVLVDYDVCIGCGYCVQNCPYDARFRNPESHMADKCTLCDHRIDKGLSPACVDACPTKARIIGDLNDSKSEVTKLVGTMSIQVLKPEKGTKPMVYYIGLDEAIEGRIEQNITLVTGV